MSVDIGRLESLRSKNSNYWADRVLAQLSYAARLLITGDENYDLLLNDAIGFLESKYAEDGALTTRAAKAAENMIAGIGKTAKNLTVICAAHAHIDMNWSWGFAETGAVTLDTFRTMLNLMNEYPSFTFSQSQASVYRIVEEYAPEMLEEINARVKEGRWEVIASNWVEADKNMPSGESHVRHILYTRRYLSRLLGINPDSLNLDFEPDTFGHNRNMPEILINGGLKYYYLCRGYAGHNIFRWEAPSGNSILVYREPDWYNASIDSRIADCVPEFCSRNKVGAMLKVYGVGDHGGGPTRRDIERLKDMALWPVFPTIKFGTFGEYFSILEKHRDRLPVVSQELNFMFTGCYTSQARIKLANRISEAKLNEAETFSALSALYANGAYPGGSYVKAWEKVLFSQFHDILTGSGVTETREYAMGHFQEALMAANSGISGALRNISAQISVPYSTNEALGKNESTSEGAGAGYAIGDYGIPQTERGAGKNRVLHIFNPSPHDRHELAEATIWDWPGRIEKMEVKDTDGASVKFQVMDGRERGDNPKKKYWDHEFTRLLVDVHVPAYGYNTYILAETGEPAEPGPAYPDDWRVEKADRFILENSLVRAVFDTADLHIVSFVDKADGREMASSDRHAGTFRLIDEDDVKGMTAWTIGRYMNIINLNHDVKVRGSYINKTALRQWIRYDIEYKRSRLGVTVSLDDHSALLEYHVECDWQEAGRRGKYVPQLNFFMPLAYKCGAYRYDIPFGTIERDSMDMDVPANSWALAPRDGGGIMMITNSKYGFRGFDDSLSLSLIRGSYNPDPYPETGIHKFRFAVGIGSMDYVNMAYDYNHPLSFIPGVARSGSLPAKMGFARLESGSVAVSAIKMPEEPAGGNNRLILRVYETDGADTRAVFSFACAVSKAWYVDINEKAADTGGNIAIEGNKAVFDVSANSLASICLEF